MRTIHLAILTALGLAACGTTAPDPRGLRDGETLLSTTATGRSEQRPDRATFDAGLSSIAPTAAAATRTNAARMTRIVTALAVFGVRKEDVQTRNVSVQRLDYGPNRGRFEAANTLTVRVRDMARVGEAVGTATTAGANIVSGPVFSIADPEKAALSANTAAYRAARAKADAYAAAAGLRVARVIAIQDGGGGGETQPLAEAAIQTAAPPPVVAAPPVFAGANTSTVAVRVDFALAPK